MQHLELIIKNPANNKEATLKRLLKKVKERVSIVEFHSLLNNAAC